MNLRPLIINAAQVVVMVLFFLLIGYEIVRIALIWVDENKQHLALAWLSQATIETMDFVERYLDLLRDRIS